MPPKISSTIEPKSIVLSFFLTRTAGVLGVGGTLVAIGFFGFEGGTGGVVTTFCATGGTRCCTGGFVAFGVGVRGMTGGNGVGILPTTWGDTSIFFGVTGDETS